MTSKPWHRPFKVFHNWKGQEILYACFLVSTARHTELTSWSCIKRIKWDKRLCLGSVRYHWPKRWDIHVNTHAKKYWSFLQPHPNKYGFIFSVRKVNMFPLRGFDWMHYKSGEDTLCSSQFKSWQSQCTHPLNHVVEINGKFPLKFTWMGELSNSLLELTVLFARPDVPVTKLPKSLTENRRDCYNVSGYQKISWCGLDMK